MTSRGNSGMTALGEEVEESKTQSLKVSLGTNGPHGHQSTTPGTTTFSLELSGHVGEYWRSAL